MIANPQTIHKEFFYRSIGVHVASKYIVKEVNVFHFKKSKAYSNKVSLPGGLLVDDTQYIIFKATKSMSHLAVKTKHFAANTFGILSKNWYINSINQLLQ